MKKKRMLIYIFIFIGIIGIGVLLAVIARFRAREGIKVQPDQTITGADTIFYLQNDSQWAKDMLGDSDYTMGSSGCLVTCIAAAMEMEGNERQNPGELNQNLSQNQGYDSEGNLQWEQLDAMDNFQVDVYDIVSLKLIQECLQQGRYPIVRVKINGNGAIHYVLIVEARDGMFYCMDPLNEDLELVPLSDYNNRVYSIRCVYPEE
ncbi:MAG: hypothetical protein ACRC3H_06070 [Lachnospiraceae bacterium]